MRRCSTRTRESTLAAGRIAVLSVGLALLSAAVGLANHRHQDGTTWVYSEELQKPKKHDRLHSNVVIPPDIDQAQVLPFSCYIRAARLSMDDILYMRARGIWSSAVYVLDHPSMTFTMFPIDSSKFTTRKDGGYSFTPVIPPAVASAIFTEGFESGDTSAWIVTEARLTKGRKINWGYLACTIRELE